MHWEILIDEPLTGAENMAVDHALMERARSREGAAVRIYGWLSPTLSLGRNQAADGRYDLDRAREAGVDFVRRPTGGRAVLHHREITYAVAAHAELLGPQPESYARINRLLVDALRRLGVDGEIAKHRAAAPPGTAPCFDEPVNGEIVAGGRKLVGSAQYREQDALLQHGSILLDDDQPLAAMFLSAPAPAPPPASTLRALLGRAPTRSEFAAALGDAIEELEARRPTPLAVDAALRASVRRWIVTYQDPRWTWRR